MKELLDEFLNKCSRINYFTLSPSAYAELKEELNIDLLKEIHKYHSITIKVSSDQTEDIYVNGSC